MPIGSVNQMVKDRLPFLDNASFDDLIERKRIEVVYLMQSQSGKTDGADVETEANYTALQNMLFSAMIAWYQIKAKIMSNMGGTGSGDSGGAKVIKKAKADVVEVEYMLTKASDGSIISMETSAFLSDLQKEICDYSRTLNWVNPLCQVVLDAIPAFIIGSDFPPCTGYLYNPQNQVWYPEGTYP